MELTSQANSRYNQDGGTSSVGSGVYLSIILSLVLSSVVILPL